MLWLQTELIDTSILLNLLHQQVSYYDFALTNDSKTETWKAFLNYWPINMETLPGVIMRHIRCLPRLLFQDAEIDHVSVMTTITVGYMIHSHLTEAGQRPRMTSMLELSLGEMKQGVALYELYHYSLWSREVYGQGLTERLPHIRELAEWHLWWGISMYESVGEVDACVAFFRHLLQQGILGMSAWIASRNDEESTYTEAQRDILNVQNDFLSTPPFSGSTTCFRTTVLLPFQRLCRYTLLLDSIITQFPDARRILSVLKSELSDAIGQINLARKSADLIADLAHTWQPQGALLFHHHNCNVRFGQRQSLTQQVALYDDVILFFQNREINHIIPRSALYDFGLEQGAAIMLRWRHHSETRTASLHMGDNDTAQRFMTILATT